MRVCVRVCVYYMRILLTGTPALAAGMCSTLYSTVKKQLLHGKLPYTANIDVNRESVDGCNYLNPIRPEPPL